MQQPVRALKAITTYRAASPRQKNEHPHDAFGITAPGRFLDRFLDVGKLRDVASPQFGHARAAEPLHPRRRVEAVEHKLDPGVAGVAIEVEARLDKVAEIKLVKQERIVRRGSLPVAADPFRHVAEPGEERRLVREEILLLAERMKAAAEFGVFGRYQAAQPRLPHEFIGLARPFRQAGNRGEFDFLPAALAERKNVLDPAGLERHGVVPALALDEHLVKAGRQRLDGLDTEPICSCCLLATCAETKMPRWPMLSCSV